MNSVYRLANISLALAFTGTVASYPFRHTIAGGLIQAACEAALVGGMADWFAVTALFRHPLGLKIPHTAIIEKNRDTLINNIADVVQNEWLTLDVIHEQVNNFNVTEKLLLYYHTPAAREYIRKLLVNALDDIINSLDMENISGLAARRIRRYLKRVDVNHLLLVFLDWLQENKYDDEIMDYLLDELIAVMKSEQARQWMETILVKAVENYKQGGGPWRKLGIDLSLKLDILNYGEAVSNVQTRALDFLREIRADREHGYRLKVKAALFDALKANLENNGSLQESLETWKADVINRLPVEKTVYSLLCNFKKKFGSTKHSGTSVAIKLTAGFLDEQVALLEKNDGKKEQVEGWIKSHLLRVVDEEVHPRLGTLVKENLNRLDNRTVIRMVERRVGKDLQYIRINGALVGGSVGVLLYLCKLLVERFWL
ncbi:DUF445 domain-containing protein [Desulfotomaculum copahuensis]|uniref:DUF445 domain-containing protein n=1 Tax=Desulfotomaculum copahuensis TaxID=1838280 RepID=A0A1B7LKI8_9FIRM|nr:DUF445 domain-containing protein [Desulfotomaculum copahuensis]OAT87085.1 hypothetical protein A6M21_02000 [Desulfotomaculum copahuensis]